MAITCHFENHDDPHAVGIFTYENDGEDDFEAVWDEALRDSAQEFPGHALEIDMGDDGSIRLTVWTPEYLAKLVSGE